VLIVPDKSLLICGKQVQSDYSQIKKRLEGEEYQGLFLLIREKEDELAVREMNINDA
jgi:hypothetical protein